jgi:hypothetical protein
MLQWLCCQRTVPVCPFEKAEGWIYTARATRYEKKETAMRILAIHDAQGNIYHTVVSPPDSPPVAFAGEPGLSVTEVEAPELGDPMDRQQIEEVRERWRVEVKPEAKLVRRTSEEPNSE